ncbi:DUF2796 domain-containing protein [Pseudomonas capeferrum]|uniref:DUF2796 domain-containing protein n=1 Tax=Pseudomonas capeferrum TaxID=1495066 RepID=UPI0015E3C5D2|nr:DUF2796 domain-containing protein [Pseudomonas capeferrum]MBA1203105.1 DUF2796 domain-containing protein [Pseudomonas capeferrum]
MRRLLLVLPFALLPLVAAHAHDEHDHAHGSLDPHEHGVASINAVLEGNALELELDSPAMNLVGFEHAASSDADKAKVESVRQQLEQPLTLFGLDKDAGCRESANELKSPLFGKAPTAKAESHGHDGSHEHEHQHSDITAHYKLTCSSPEKLAQIDLAPLFKAFPTTHKINVQLIGPNGQKGMEANASQAAVAF